MRLGFCGSPDGREGAAKSAQYVSYNCSFWQVVAGQQIR
jgi:hypothetical protein